MNMYKIGRRLATNQLDIRRQGESPNPDPTNPNTNPFNPNVHLLNLTYCQPKSQMVCCRNVSIPCTTVTVCF